MLETIKIVEKEKLWTWSERFEEEIKEATALLTK